MLLLASHKTIYEYAGPAVENYNEVRLAPESDVNQTVREFSLEIVPDAQVFSYRTVNGLVHHFGVRERHFGLEFTARCLVDCLRSDPFVSLDLASTDTSFYYEGTTQQLYTEFLSSSHYVPLNAEIFDLAATLKLVTIPNAVERILELKRWVYEWLTYIPGITTVASTAQEVAQHRAGVCQDYAHLMIALARCVGIPARYVSGYLFAGGDESIRGDQATHAWVECLLPSGEWFAVDPTNCVAVNDHYIRVHCGVDYSEALPSKGIYVGPRTTRLSVSVDVQRMPSYEHAWIAS